MDAKSVVESLTEQEQKIVQNILQIEKENQHIKELNQAKIKEIVNDIKRIIERGVIDENS